MSDLEQLLAELEKLKAENALLRAQQQAEAHDGSAVAQNQSKAVATGGMLIEGNVYLGPKTDDPNEALRIYRQVLLQNTAHLTLRGLDKGAADPTQGQKPVGLVNVYIDLNTTVQEPMPSGQPSRKTAKSNPTDAFQSEKSQPLTALKATISNRRMVLLGDPGSGKSTFVRYLTHCLAAHPLEPEAGWLEHLQNWPPNETTILPIPVILRDFAQHHKSPLPERAEVNHLWNFLAARLTAQNLDFARQPLRQVLENGQALVLLDGLDEIPTPPQRRFVRDAVRAFIQRYPHNRYLITCRVLSYQPPETPDQPDIRLTELPDFKLAPFDEEKIGHFIEAWYQELSRLGTISSEDAPGLVAKLTRAVRRPELWRLAPNPMLLTVMAVVHADRGRLPDARALLYEEIIDILLWRWEENKQGGQTDLPRLRQLLYEAGRSEVDLKRVLWELAYEAHAGAIGNDQALTDIGELRLLKALAALKNEDHNWAIQMVEAMKLRAGLLVERTPEIFTFPHRTFQEYLAGAHLASQAKFAETGTGLAEQGALWWEVILLATGKLVYLSGDLDKPLALVGELCPARLDETRSEWKKVSLAGDVLAEMGIKRVQDRTLGQDFLPRVQERMVDLLERNALTAQERAYAGN
ncbi:MAG TPA: NACHT domain-containing protein, partial [Anaerolineales bacterium]|nr:NACHT domain-containing protein [Anaerolineales bacterium]